MRPKDVITDVIAEFPSEKGFPGRQQVSVFFFSVSLPNGFSDYGPKDRPGILKVFLENLDPETEEVLCVRQCHS